jgi:DNA-3-methyladenine glycosylase
MPAMPEPIPTEIFQRKNTVTLARGLLGQVLVRRRQDGSETRHVITETEAYHGAADLACHASKGRTKRTDVMFRPGGVWYVYLCYGVHEMLNLVTGPEGFPSAVLIRGVRGANGPGRLTKALGIGRALNGLPVAPETGLWIEPGEFRVPASRIRVTPRIGVDYAGPEWAAKPWRFVWDLPLAEKADKKVVKIKAQDRVGRSEWTADGSR